MSVLQDLRYGTRLLRKSPGLSTISILALAIGIGLTTTMFSIVYGGVLRGLPFEEAERIMHLERSNVERDIQSMEVTQHDFADWRAQQRSFSGLGAFYTGTVNVSGTERAERYDGAFISANAFEILRVRPHLGRTFRQGEDMPGAEPVALIGYQLWQDRFGGDAGVIGQTIRANGVPTTIVGVMPPRFEFPFREDIWIPLTFDPIAVPRGDGMTVEVFGRLVDGVSMDAAALEMNAIAKRLALEYPQTNEGVAAVVQPFTKEYIGDDVSAMLYTMLGAVFFVLIIACANVANLLLGRAAIRSKEIGVRTALGATRSRVIRQFLSEAVVLSLVGAALGLLIGFAGVRMFNDAIAATNPPFWIDIRIDPVVLAFVVGVALFSSIVAGTLPALQASRIDVSEILKDESRGSSSFRVGKLSRGLVIVEVALSCGLLVGAGLMVRSVTNLASIDYGFTTQDVFTARVGLPSADQGYAEPAARIRFFDDVLAKVGAIQGVTKVALTSALPLGGGGYTQLAIEGQAYAKDTDYPGSRQLIVSPGYYDALDVKVLQGRDFGSEDRTGSLPVAIVNEGFARKLFAGENPVGRRIRFGGAQSQNEWRTIVGLVPDLYVDGVENENPEAVYIPYAQSDARFMSIVARARGDVMSLTPAVRDAVASADSDIPIYFVESLEASMGKQTWFYRVFGTIFMIFGGVALFLAAIGLYAVMAFSVSNRIREFGVRMALGAQGTDVIGMVFRQGFVQIAIGLVIGIGLAAAVAGPLSILLYGVTARDPIIFGSVVLLLAATGLLACFIPARRATRVDPMVALRSE